MMMDFQNEKGMALVMVLVFTGALLIVGAALLTFAVNEAMIVEYAAANMQIQYLAESGIVAALAVLAEDYYFEGDLEGSIAEGSYTVRFYNGVEGDRIIMSQGALGGYRKTIRVRVSFDSSGMLQTSEWRQTAGFE